MDSFSLTQVIPDDSAEIHEQQTTEIGSIVGYLVIDGCHHAVRTGETKIGRDPSTCSIVLTNKTLSKIHAVIESEDADSTFIYDAESTNKTKLGRMVLKPQARYRIEDGEIITLGNVNAKFITEKLRSAKDDEELQTQSMQSSPLNANTSETPSDFPGQNVNIFEIETQCQINQTSTPDKSGRANHTVVRNTSSPAFKTPLPPKFNKMNVPFEKTLARSDLFSAKTPSSSLSSVFSQETECQLDDIFDQPTQCAAGGNSGSLSNTFDASTHCSVNEIENCKNKIKKEKSVCLSDAIFEVDTQCIFDEPTQCSVYSNKLGKDNTGSSHGVHLTDTVFEATTQCQLESLNQTSSSDVFDAQTQCQLNNVKIPSDNVTNAYSAQSPNPVFEAETECQLGLSVSCSSDIFDQATQCQLSTTSTPEGDDYSIMKRRSRQSSQNSFNSDIFDLATQCVLPENTKAVSVKSEEAEENLVLNNIKTEPIQLDDQIKIKKETGRKSDPVKSLLNDGEDDALCSFMSINSPTSKASVTTGVKAEPIILVIADEIFDMPTQVLEFESKMGTVKPEIDDCYVELTRVDPDQSQTEDSDPECTQLYSPDTSKGADKYCNETVNLCNETVTLCDETVVSDRNSENNACIKNGDASSPLKMVISSSDEDENEKRERERSYLEDSRVLEDLVPTQPHKSTLNSSRMEEDFVATQPIRPLTGKSQKASVEDDILTQPFKSKVQSIRLHEDDVATQPLRQEDLISTRPLQQNTDRTNENLGNTRLCEDEISTQVFRVNPSPSRLREDLIETQTCSTRDDNKVAVVGSSDDDTDSDIEVQAMVTKIPKVSPAEGPFTSSLESSLLDIDDQNRDSPSMLQEIDDHSSPTGDQADKEIIIEDSSSSERVAVLGGCSPTQVVVPDEDETQILDVDTTMKPPATTAGGCSPTQVVVPDEDETQILDVDLTMKSPATTAGGCSPTQVIPVGDESDSDWNNLSLKLPSTPEFHKSLMGSSKHSAIQGPAPRKVILSPVKRPREHNISPNFEAAKRVKANEGGCSPTQVILSPDSSPTKYEAANDGVLVDKEDARKPTFSNSSPTQVIGIDDDLTLNPEYDVSKKFMSICSPTQVMMEMVDEGKDNDDDSDTDCEEIVKIPTVGSSESEVPRAVASSTPRKNVAKVSSDDDSEFGNLSLEMVGTQDFQESLSDVTRLTTDPVFPSPVKGLIRSTSISSPARSVGKKDESDSDWANLSLELPSTPDFHSSLMEKSKHSEVHAMPLRKMVLSPVKRPRERDPSPDLGTSKRQKVEEAKKEELKMTLKKVVEPISTDDLEVSEGTSFSRTLRNRKATWKIQLKTESETKTKEKRTTRSAAKVGDSSSSSTTSKEASKKSVTVQKRGKNAVTSSVKPETPNQPETKAKSNAPSTSGTNKRQTSQSGSTRKQVQGFSSSEAESSEELIRRPKRQKKISSLESENSEDIIKISKGVGRCRRVIKDDSSQFSNGSSSSEDDVVTRLRSAMRENRGDQKEPKSARKVEKQSNKNPESELESRRSARIQLNRESPATKLNFVNFVNTRKKKQVRGVESASSRTPSPEPPVIPSFFPNPDVKIIFTGIENLRLQNIIRELGGETTRDIHVAQVMVTDKVRRTVKFLSAIGLALPIVSPQWLVTCKDAKIFVNPWDHILKDAETEKLLEFNLRETLEGSKISKLLEGYSVFLTATTISSKRELLSVVECSGGTPLVEKPELWPEKTIVVSCEEDKKLWPPVNFNYIQERSLTVSYQKPELVRWPKPADRKLNQSTGFENI